MKPFILRNAKNVLKPLKMKILLLGEYSNVHATLAKGLRALGHEVLVVSNGDFWKNYPRDIDIKRDPNWVEAHKYASPDEIFEGEIGKINNVRFVETSEAKIWKGTGCPEGLAVFGTLVLGAHAYATTELEGGGMQHIVKQLGYGDDPLNQRASVGWKAVKTAERLSEQYMVRIESCSERYSAKAQAN